MLPAQWYRVFVIEERFHFNNTTLKLFVRDHLRSLAIDLVISAIAYPLLLLAYRLTGRYFAVVGCVLVMVLVLVLQVVFPILILPLFITLTPLEEGDVRRAVESLASECRFSLAAIFSMDGSKRSSKQNAMVFGLFSHTVAIDDTLLEKCTAEDVAAVVGHEIGHASHHHLWKLMGLQQILVLGFLTMLDRILKSDEIFSDFGFVDERPFVVGIALLMSFAGPIGKILTLPLNLFARSCEFQADEFAATKKLDLAGALLRISTENKQVLTSDPLYAAFNQSHPTLDERVTAIRKIEAKTK
jgi:STE24 endopeptidase